jgi:hypothetical protein
MARAKAEQLVAPPAVRPIETLHIIGEPERLCGNCQHMGERERGTTQRKCHNLNSGRATVVPKDLACRRAFYPDCERFPLVERLGIRA